MKIEQDKMVAIHYTLTDESGKVLDSSVESTPLLYLHGNGYLISGLEKELEGKETGDKFEVTVQPEEAYGTYDERLIASVPRDRFEFDGEIEVGMNFQVQTPGGPTIVRVVEVGDTEIKIDGNHELAGKALTFSIEVVEVRDPSEEELAQLTASNCGGGCGGCGGSCGGGCGGDCNGDCGGDCENGCGGEGCNCGN